MSPGGTKQQRGSGRSDLQYDTAEQVNINKSKVTKTPLASSAIQLVINNATESFSRIVRGLSPNNQHIKKKALVITGGLCL